MGQSEFACGPDPAGSTSSSREEDLAGVFDTLEDFVFILDDAGRILHWNAQVERRLGYSAGELAGMNVLEVHPPDRRDEAAEILGRLLEGKASECPVPLVTSDGRLVPVQTRVIRGRWRGRTVLFGIAHDLSERRSVEEALQKSEARFRAIFEEAAIGVALADAEGTMLEGNVALADMLGYTVEEFVGKHAHQFTHPDDIAAEVQAFAELYQGRRSAVRLEKRYLHRDGHVVWGRLSASLIADAAGRPGLVIGCVENISEWKRAEQALRESEQRYRMIADHVSDVICSLRLPEQGELFRFEGAGSFSADIEKTVSGWRFEYLSPSAERLLGYPLDECLQLPLDRVLTAESLRNVAAVAAEDLLAATSQPEQPTPRRRLEIQCIRRDGSIRWCEITSTFLRDDEGRVVRAVGVVRDITERREAERALREREALLGNLFENLPDVVAMIDTSNNIRFINRVPFPGDPAPSSIIGQLGNQFVWPEHLGQFSACLDLAVATGRPQATEVRDMMGRWWACRLVPMIEDGQVQNLMAICTDISRQKEAAEAVQKEQRLLRQLLDLHERDRQLFAYEVHDGFTQLLTGAMFQLQAAERLQRDDPEGARQLLEQVSKLLGRSIDETRRLISGLRPPILDEQGIVAAIDYLICENQERHGARLEFRHDVSFERLAPPLENAAFRIVQESLANACRHTQSDRVLVELSEDNGHVRICVQDWGTGFDPASVHANRFGLRGIRERARLLGGKVRIVTATGQGTRIEATLPLIEPAGDHALTES
jgi:PAS domain S-box-containing protein